MINAFLLESLVSYEAKKWPRLQFKYENCTELANSNQNFNEKSRGKND